MKKQRVKRSLGRYRARCLLCSWVSNLNTGPVFAGYNAITHSKMIHSDAEGIVAIIEEENQASSQMTAVDTPNTSPDG